MVNNKRVLTATGILIAAFLAQFAGHLLLKVFMPNIAVGGIGFLFITLIFSYVLFFRGDLFGFILVVYVCSHFNYADQQGGLWNLMTFGFLTLFYLFNGQRSEVFRKKDISMSVLMGIFILWNFVGWVLNNPLPIIPRLQGVAALLGCLLMFKLASNVIITKERFRLFLTITVFMIIYQFLVAINQRHNWVNWNSPLIGAYSEKGSLINEISVNYHPAGTLQHFELFGEYGLLLSCLLIPLLSSSFTQRDLQFGSNKVVVLIFFCLSFIILTSNRAAALLEVFAVTLFYVIFATRIFTALDRVGRQSRILIVLAVLLPVVGIYIGLDGLQEDFASLAPSMKNLSVDNVVSGKAINRGALYSMGMERLKSESWWFGYGYGIPRSNRWAWFGVDPETHDLGIADLHSLYLSLPELFGWFGSLAFIAMIILTWFRAFSTAILQPKRKGFLQVLAIGFTVFWLVFLINEYKISILRNADYHMLFWIWLGLSNSVIKTIRLAESDKKFDGLSLLSVKNEIRQ